MAQEAGLDLVEIAPNSSPPVCKILDYGKYKYQAQKKAAEARKKQKVVEIKEIKLRPMIDDHDYDVKMRSMQRFFEEGDKVKVTLRFRGREMAHQELGYKLLDRVKGDTAKIRQDRAGAALRRPPGGHGAGAALKPALSDDRNSELPGAVGPGQASAAHGICHSGRLCHNRALPVARLIRAAVAAVTCSKHTTLVYEHFRSAGAMRLRPRRAKCPRSRPSRALKSASR